MRRFIHPWLFLLLPLALLVSCGGDDNDNGTNAGAEPDIPEFAEADVPDQVDFGSEDQNAQSAEAIVNSQLAMAKGLTLIGQAYTAPLAAANWSGEGGDCYSYSVSTEGCTATYQVCDLGAEGYEWTYTLNGTCSGSVYAQWVAMRGTMNAAGTTGAFRLYEDNTTVVDGGWEWTVAEDRESGTWNFYDGEIGTGTLEASLAWTKNTDGSSDITLTFPEDYQFITHVSGDQDFGWMEYYEWDTEDEAFSTLVWNITWASDGTGWWRSYDADGSLEDELTW